MRGFTLLEVLVAMAMTGIIMAGLYGAYSSNVDAIQGARQDGEASQTARAVLDLMVRDLESVLVEGNLGVTGEDRTIGAQPADRFAVTTERSESGGGTEFGTDLRTITYFVEEDTDSDELILYRKEEGLAGAGVSMGAMTYELARNVKALDIVYGDHTGKESDAWSAGGIEGEMRIPTLIRIRLVLSAGPDRELTFETGVRPGMNVYTAQ
jgi:prepilin-type N-terminal cleavage/methylation domain-containing protein